MKTLNTFGIDKEESVIPTDTKHPSEINESNYDEAFAKSIHLGYDGGLYVTEEDYLKYVKGEEDRIASKCNYDYIYVIKEGKFRFCYYGPQGLKFITPNRYDTQGNLVEDIGVYCFNAYGHKPIWLKNSTAIYYGSYNGKYAECVFDSHYEKNYEVEEDSTIEYILLTKEPVEFYKVIYPSTIQALNSVPKFGILRSLYNEHYCSKGTCNIPRMKFEHFKYVLDLSLKCYFSSELPENIGANIIRTSGLLNFYTHNANKLDDYHDLELLSILPPDDLGIYKDFTIVCDEDEALYIHPNDFKILVELSKRYYVYDLEGAFNSIKNKIG